MREDPVVIGPEPDGARPPSGLVLWLHGLGADGHDFAPLIPLLRRPDLRVVLPHAPVRPVTLNGGFPMRAWYDIRHLSPGPDREPASHVRESAGALSELLRREQAACGLPWERVLVAGFSQGGAMALHLGLRWPERLAGVVALSTYLVLEDTLSSELSEAAQDLPLFMAHGIMDPTVAMQRGEAAARRVEDTVALTWREYPMGHEVCPEEIRDLSAWLDRTLPPA